MSADLTMCSHAAGTRYDPNGVYECANRAKWQTVQGKKPYCGRHIRHVGRVEPLEHGSITP